MLSNLHTYLAIAEQALLESHRHDADARRQRPDGEPGSIITFDPDRKSFKQSLVALVFAGVYLEALLFVVGVQRLGKAEYLKIDRKFYEEKLRALGVTDHENLAVCKRFREARNDLVHEKAVDVNALTSSELRYAQEEATVALSFVRSISELLRHVP